MRYRRPAAIVGLIAIAVSVYYSWWVFASGDVFFSSRRNAPNRAALLQLHDAIEIGISHAEVLSAYWQHRTKSLRVFADEPTAWTVTTPLEFGATNWTLVIEFRHDLVSAVRLRTADGPPPHGGPKDKVAPG